MIDTKPGPLVLDVPPRRARASSTTSGCGRWATWASSGPTRQGGRYLLVPPGYEGDLPTEGFVADHPVAHLPPVAGAARVHGRRAATRLRPSRPSGRRGSTRSLWPATRRRPGTSTPRGCRSTPSTPTDVRYFEDLATMVDYEPADAISLEEARQLAQIGIEKGKPFAPDARMRGILDEAARSAASWRSRSRTLPAATTDGHPTANGSASSRGYPSFEDEHGRPADRPHGPAWPGSPRAVRARWRARAGRRLRLHLGLPRRERRLDRPGAHLPAPVPGPDPGQGLLVGRGLRPVDPLDARQRPAITRASARTRPASSDRRRWRRRHLHRPGAARRQRGATGSAHSPASAGSRSSASTGRSNPGSTPAGNPTTSNPSASDDRSETLFVTVGPVEVHLGHTYRKRGIRSGAGWRAGWQLDRDSERRGWNGAGRGDGVHVAAAGRDAEPRAGPAAMPRPAATGRSL